MKIYALVCISVMALLQNETLAQVDVRQIPYIQSNASRDDVSKYATFVKNLAENPKPIDMMTPSEVSMLLGRVGGSYTVQVKISPQELSDLRDYETMLIGLAINSLESRLDPTVTATHMVAYDVPIPYDQTADRDVNNDAKRKAYNDSRDAIIAKYEHINNQVILKEKLRFILKGSAHSLLNMYEGHEDQVPREKAILKKVGLNDAIIDLLTKN